MVLVNQRQLLIEGEPVRVGSRAFDILLELIARGGEVVTKHDLLSAVWPGFVVDDNNLAVHVGALRRLLGAGSISTVPGRGYRLELSIQPLKPTPEPDAPPASEAPSDAEVPAASNLGMMVGRQLDLDSLNPLVTAHALTSLVGAAGIGKSTLAQRVLQMHSDRFAGGAVWCDLDSLVDPSVVCSRLAQALSLKQRGKDLLEELANMLRPMSMLLVLDGAEHVIEEAARVVGTLLQVAPGVHFLVTSQVPLRLEAEHVLRLQPLSIPASTATAAQALEHGSVQLFVTRASQGAGDFSLTDANVADVITVCRRLDGIPLAIELAAARTATLGTAALARMLDHRLRLLRSFSRSTSARHATLKAALDWSHGLLSHEERLVFRRSGVFHRSFSMQALLAVANDGALGEDQVVESLRSLIDKSLVQMEPGTPTRYRLLESTHSLANEYLEEAGEIETTRRRHAVSIVARFRDALRDVNTGHFVLDDIRTSLQLDRDNAQAAMSWALVHDPQSACELMPALSFALADANFLDVKALWHATQQHFSDELPLNIRAAWAQGCASFWSNRDIQAMDHWATIASRLYHALGDRDGMYCAQASLVLVAARRSQSLDEQLGRLHALMHPSLTLTSLRFGTATTALAALVSGDPDLGMHLLHEALQLAKRIGDSFNVIVAQVNLLDAALGQGRVDDAIAHGLAAVEHIRQSRRQSMLGMAQLNLAAAYAAKGESHHVADLVREGWPQAITEGLQPYWADYLALTCAQQGLFTDAARLLGYGDTLYAQYHTRRVANELAAATQAQRLATESLGIEALDAARRQGSRLGDDDIPQVIATLRKS